MGQNLAQRIRDQTGQHNRRSNFGEFRFERMEF